MATPPYSAPHNGILGDASGIAHATQINQFLGTHTVTPIYQGNVVSSPSQYTCGAGGPYKESLSTVDFDQPFTMSGTTVGRVQIPVLPVGQGVDLLVSLCADSSGSPGTIVAQTRVPASWIYQLAPVAGTATEAVLTPSLAMTGNALATPQSSMIEMANLQLTSYPTPAATGISAASSCTWYYPYIVEIGGVNAGAALSTVFTVPYDTDGTLGKSIPQPAFPVTNDGSSASIVVIDAQSGTPIVVNTGGGTSFRGAPVSSVYTASLDTSTGSLSAWSAQTSLPYAVQAHVMAAANGYVYVIGGGTPAGGLANVSYAQVQNSQITGWSAATPLPQPMVLNFAAVCSGYLVVAGGQNSVLSVVYTSCWYARINSDGSLGSWIPGPSMPTGDYDLNSNAYGNDYGIICGGNLHVSCLTFTEAGPGLQWAQSDDSSGRYPGFFDGDNGLVSAGTQAGGLQWRFDSWLFPYISVPLPASGLTSGATYHVLLQQQGGDLADYLLLPISHGLGIAGQTSARGAYSWTALPMDGTHLVGPPLSVFDNTPLASAALPTPLHLWSDGGARITTIVSATTPDRRPLGICEATAKAYALNSNTGFETGLAPWVWSGGTAVRSAAQAFEGFYAAQFTPDGVSAQGGLGSETLSCMPGQQVTVEARLWFTSAVAANASVSVNWFTLGGGYITTSYNLVSAPAATWTELSNQFTAPAGAYTFTFGPTLGGTPPATQVWYAGLARASIAATGPQHATVTQITYAGTYPWPWPGTGTVQLA